MSFVLDIPALLLTGYFVGIRLSSLMPLEDRRKNDALVAVSLASTFPIVAIPMYFDVLDVSWIGSAGSGRNFMWNSGMELVG